MEYQNYEDYMRKVLGYSPNNSNIYANPSLYEPTYEYSNQLLEEEVNAYYPEIYQMVYPMVCRVCKNITQNVNSELIEKLTDEVYQALDNTEPAENARMEPKKENSPTSGKRTENRMERTPRRTEISAERTTRKVEEKREDRRPNFSLRDLIKILIIRELLNNRKPPRNRNDYLKF